jgi:2-succinyl-6-hydroxy-2,4-cyclohexadiene-1-carboxylate synthase
MSLISVGPWVFGYSSPAAEALFADMAQVGVALADGGHEAAVDAWMRAPFFSATIIEPAAGELFREIAKGYSFWEFSHKSPREVLEPSAAQRTGEIKAPTLILTAEHDIPACLEIADLLNESISDSRKVVMKGTGHLLHMEKPAEFNKYVLDFVQAVGGGGV